MRAKGNISSALLIRRCSPPVVYRKRFFVPFNGVPCFYGVLNANRSISALHHRPPGPVARVDFITTLRPPPLRNSTLFPRESTFFTSASRRTFRRISKYTRNRNVWNDVLFSRLLTISRQHWKQ